MRGRPVYAKRMELWREGVVFSTYMLYKDLSWEADIEYPLTYSFDFSGNGLLGTVTDLQKNDQGLVTGQVELSPEHRDLDLDDFEAGGYYTNVVRHKASDEEKKEAGTQTDFDVVTEGTLRAISLIVPESYPRPINT